MFIWTIGDAIGCAGIIILVLVSGCVGLAKIIRQARCKHDTVFENGACDAICSLCGKNLGFIGSWRKTI